MMLTMKRSDPSAPRELCKLITCIVPDDGTDKQVITGLRDEKKIVRADSTTCSGTEVLAQARTKFDELPEPVLMRKIEVIVSADRADEIYDYIYQKAGIGLPQRGIMWLGESIQASPFSLPENIPIEKTRKKISEPG